MEETPLKAGIRGALIGLLMGIAFAGGFIVNDLIAPASEPTESYALLDEAQGLLANHYLRDLPEEEDRIHGAVSGLVASLEDPYTFFVEPQSAEVDQGDLAGRFGGIGATLGRDEDGNFVITRVYDDNPAAEAGLQADDILLAVDGEPLDSGAPDSNAVISLIRGEIGTMVVLTVERGEERLDIEIVRAEVLIPSVFWEMTETPGIGYIQLTRFTDRAPEEIREAIADLRQQGAQALVLDLRGNGGGLVDSAVDIANEFINSGVILYELHNDGSETTFEARRTGTAPDIPLVVLVNNGSASASEIVAGALRDSGRATLIGQQTFGKGSVQLIFEMSDGSSLHVTSAEWYTPDRVRIEGNGLTPDIVVDPVEGMDSELTAAVEYLEQQLQIAERP